MEVIGNATKQWKYQWHDLKRASCSEYPPKVINSFHQILDRITGILLIIHLAWLCNVDIIRHLSSNVFPPNSEHLIRHYFAKPHWSQFGDVTRAAVSSPSLERCCGSSNLLKSWQGCFLACSAWKDVWLWCESCVASWVVLVAPEMSWQRTRQECL